jgi:hypothetical protein
MRSAALLSALPPTPSAPFEQVGAQERRARGGDAEQSASIHSGSKGGRTARNRRSS